MDHQPPLYDRDFYAWTQDQAARLRAAAAARSNLDLDFENLAEEVEDMGKSERRAAESSLARIIEHLLKLEYSPASHPRAKWVLTVNRHRRAARGQIDESRSLLAKIRLEMCYADGRDVMKESLLDHGEPIPDLPETCPYSLDQLLADGWFPVNRHGLTD